MSVNASLWKGPLKPTLASGSASRRLLLESAGIDVDVAPARVDERALERAFFASGGEASQLASRLARAKALEVSGRRPSALCIGADQTLLLAESLLHKPADMAAAASNLQRLAGRSHLLIAAVCVAREGVVLFEAVRNARMTMRALDEGAIQRYLAAAGPAILSSVGAYQIEGIGIHLFEAIEGDCATIIGLPLLDLLRWLRSRGLLTI